MPPLAPSILPCRLFLALPAAALLSGSVRSAQPGSTAAAEAAYARAVAVIADSAIRQLDVLPERTQLRVQTAFLEPGRAAAVPFGQLARLGASAFDVADSMTDRFGGIAPPADLARLHAELIASLRDAREAIAHMVSAADACSGDPASLQRCQVPFTAASGALGRAQRRYLDVRRRLGHQVTDTGTILPAFASAGPGKQ
ncbi:hypothetical protein J421_0861 [Gemmatirosa kalamazoonensis]|jgi:hypothetical protein|uniref:Uncharacterized protein n=1 Tax=Gemmatirosa kalamazoonensis TaxID=861299 RepID=W0RG76_9BACT|nr:hypothetical protein [Gemmatirosa kalamazoonensis]AHG88398.1 hypothetical protein J421_0861 [Gemmatirosa kalamazoonensis]